MKKVTVWEAWDSNKKVFKHNHIENGWSDKDTPVAFCERQSKAWSRTKFIKKYAYLTSDFVVKRSLLCRCMPFLKKLLKNMD